MYVSKFIIFRAQIVTMPGKKYTYLWSNKETRKSLLSVKLAARDGSKMLSRVTFRLFNSEPNRMRLHWSDPSRLELVLVGSRRAGGITDNACCSFNSIVQSLIASVFRSLNDDCVYPHLKTGYWPEQQRYFPRVDINHQCYGKFPNPTS